MCAKAWSPYHGTCRPKWASFIQPTLVQFNAHVNVGWVQSSVRALGVTPGVGVSRPLRFWAGVGRRGVAKYY